MTKALWVYCPSPMFSKICTFLHFYILSHLFTFWNSLPFPPSSPPPPSPLHSRFYKPYPQSKTILNRRVVPSGAVFCSNAVLITTPSSFMQFFSFFNVLSRAPTTTGMTLMLIMFHILLISLIRSSYLSIFSFYFSLTPISPVITISIMALLFSLLFTATISGFLILISLSHWIITSQKIFTSLFSTTPSAASS